MDSPSQTIIVYCWVLSVPPVNTGQIHVTFMQPMIRYIILYHIYIMLSLTIYMKEPAPHSKKFSYHKNEINETQPVNILKKFIYTGYTQDLFS